MLEIKFKPKSKDEEQKSIMDNEGRDTLQNPSPEEQINKADSQGENADCQPEPEINTGTGIRKRRSAAKNISGEEISKKKRKRLRSG